MSLKLHPLSGGSSRNLLDRGLTYGVDFKYLPRFLSTLGFSLAGAPSRMFDRARFNSQIHKFSQQEDPVFIVGHWRSGTTYLHHLMSQDKRFSYVSSYQAAVPELFLSDTPSTRAIVVENLPQKRPMDNIELSLQKPEEEEVLMANTSPYSFIHTFSFPKKARQIFNSSILFQGLTEKELRSWSEAYLRAIKIACMGMQANRPLLKSPGNTARIRLLLKLFPNAKFVHIYRNPYTVFTSTVHAYSKLMEVWQFQEISPAEIEENVFYAYEKVMQRFFEDKSLISPSNLIEIRYETFEQDQLNTLQAIYSHFGLSDFDSWKYQFKEYIDRYAQYQKNDYALDPDVVAKIRSRWGFAIDRWNYDPPHS